MKHPRLLLLIVPLLVHARAPSAAAEPSAAPSVAPPRAVEVQIAQASRRGRTADPNGSVDGSSTSRERQRASRSSREDAAQRGAKSPSNAGSLPPLPVPPPPAPAPPPTQSGSGNVGDAAAGASDPEVEAAKQRVAEMQALTEAHIKDMAAVSEDFQAKMKSATTPEQRKTLQQEYLQTQRAKQEDYQRKMTEMKAR